MTTHRNLGMWVNGDPAREAVRRTIDEMSLRLSRMEQMITALAQKPNSNGSGLTLSQQQEVLGLVAARSSAVIGQEVTDPLIVGLPTNNGSVTSFSAGDLAPLFTTTESTVTTTPALAFAPIPKAKNLVYAGPASGVDANPDFRLLVLADFSNEAWTTYSPAVTTGTGSITTLGTVTGRSSRLGTRMTVELDISITTNGTGATYVKASLPVVASTATGQRYALSGAEVNLGDKSLTCEISGGFVFIFLYDGSYPGADGCRFALSGVYEAA